MNMRKVFFLAIAFVLLAAGCCPKKQQTMNKDFLTVAQERYSVRKFTDTPVGQDLIDKIIEAGKVAPTAVNSQPQKIYVATSAESVAKLNTLSPCLYGASQCFIVCYNTDNACKRGENGTYGEIDATIVLTHMMLEAANLGIGTCPVGYFDPAKLKAEFGLPDNIVPVLLLPFGYAAEDAVPSERHSEFRPLEETVEYL